jgi:Ca-activated chloride channel family protein
MKQQESIRQQYRRQIPTLFLSLALALSPAADSRAANQLLLARGGSNVEGTWTGVVDLVIDPGFEHARVNVTVDGHRVAQGLTSPHRVVVDFGPEPIQHRITITATGANGRRSQWTETINEGILPFGIQVKAVNPGAGQFEVTATAPPRDPIAAVELWHDGELIDSRMQAPYRFDVPPHVVGSGLVQFSARSKSGEEVADFWSSTGTVLARELQIRTVPIFVSVVDRDGNTHDDIDRSKFRILDNDTEATIVKFGKAFDQPISIALVLDASASMTYSLEKASKAAAEFVEHALKEGDRCSVTAIQDVPRRRQPLTEDREAISAALAELQPSGATALYDAVEAAIRELGGEKRRRAIVVLSDGSDTASLATFKEIEKRSQQAAIPIYFIAYAGADDDGRTLDRLRYLAAQTGGFVATATKDNLADKYGEIEKDLRAQFAITYQISDFGKSNEWRQVRVVIDSPSLSARTIKGYFTP